MNKNGFTFIELLAIIVLIGLITVIAVPSIKLADKKIQEKNFKTKVELIEKAGESYGDDHRDLILNSSEMYSDPNGVSYPEITITVRDLLNSGYITKDPGLKREDVLDPRDDSSILTNKVRIYVKNNHAYAKLEI